MVRPKNPTVIRAIRFPVGLKEQIERRAAANVRSFNGEVIALLIEILGEKEGEKNERQETTSGL